MSSTGLGIPLTRSLGGSGCRAMTAGVALIVAESALVKCPSRDVADSSCEGSRGAALAKHHLELELRALGERLSRLGDERAHNRARGFDVSDEACALTADNEKCFFVAGRDGLVQFGEHWCRVDLDLVRSRLHRSTNSVRRSRKRVRYPSVPGLGFIALMNLAWIQSSDG